MYFITKSIFKAAFDWHKKKIKYYIYLKKAGPIMIKIKSFEKKIRFFSENNVYVKT